jgi:hypothetical protein
LIRSNTFPAPPGRRWNLQRRDSRYHCQRPRLSGAGAHGDKTTPFIPARPSPSDSFLAMISPAFPFPSMPSCHPLFLGSSNNFNLGNCFDGPFNYNILRFIMIKYKNVKIMDGILTSDTMLPD